MENELDRMESEIIDALEKLQKKYQEEAEPYIKELSRIRSMKPIAPIMIDSRIYRYVGPRE